MIDAALDDDERQDWLKNYVRTYLERDIRDIASFRDLEPFIKLQHYLARQIASLVNYQSMATHCRYCVHRKMGDHPTHLGVRCQSGSPAKSPLAGYWGIKYPVDTMLEQDIRWKQRFENFKRTRANLELALSLPQRDIVQRAGLVHFFELAFELSWKVMKDYLEAQGFEEIDSPRQTLRTAFEAGLIQEGSAWLKGLEARNLTTHLYNEEKAVEIERLIQTTYAPLFRDLEQVLLDKAANE